MKINSSWYAASRLSLSVGLIGGIIGLFLGIVAGFQPLLLCLAVSTLVLVVCFFTYFEQTVLGLLILRSSLDVFSDWQIPALFAIGVDVLTLIYVAMLVLSKKKIKVDGFWYFFAAWVALQSLWVILIPLGGLGSDASVLSDSIREWVRLFSWLMIYLLVMQLKDRVHPEKIIFALFLSLVAPLTAATLQVLLPPSMLPSFLVFESGYSVEAGSRMNGTLGHPSTFATFVLLFFGLSLWKLGETKDRRLSWIILVGALAFFLVSSKSLTGMIILMIFIPAFFAPKLNFVNFIGAAFLLTIIVSLFISSELGQERLQSLYGTPLLNPDIDHSLAILLHWEDGNSFNWRIAQWTFLLQSWEKYPIWGYGLGTIYHISIFDTAAHNDYVRFLVEEGIVGFTIFLTFLAAQVARLIQLARSVSPGSPKRNLCWLMLAFLVALLGGMLTENILAHTTLFFYWWTLMAIAGWNWTPSTSKDIDLAA